VKYASSVDLAVAPEVVLPFVNDLSRYVDWMPLVHSAEVAGEDLWDVELRAKVGVFARSKRLRMRKTIDDGVVVVFERDEADGRRHSPWVLRVTVSPTRTGSTVQMDLAYGGNLWTAGVLDRVLAHQVDEGKAGLVRVVSGA
jgi:carbon monoxide dehydrogenase subunit G